MSETDSVLNDIEANFCAGEEPLPTHSPQLKMSASEPGYKSNTLAPVPVKRVKSTPLPKVIDEAPEPRWKYINLNSLFPPVPIPVMRRRSTSVPVFYCQICMENHSIEDSFEIKKCEIRHKFCRDSLSGYLMSQINDGMVTLACPCIGEGCNGTYTDEEIQELVDDVTFQKYARFREIKANPDYRECPKCNKSTVGDKESPIITCSECAEVYCYFHSNAHPNMSCSDYSRVQQRLDMQSTALIQRVSRKCPQCGAATEKNGGCNHMTCQHCQEVSRITALLYAA
jgi:hypothetical protein